jgi:hypothetical protein
MSDRTGGLFKLFGTLVTNTGLVLSMLAIAPDAGWSQAAPEPTLGMRSPARQ